MNWKKTSLLASILTIAFIILLFYAFNLKIIGASSSDIEFSADDILPQTQIDSSVKKPKNIILFIADGMGFSHLSLAMQMKQPEKAPLLWQQFDVKGWHDTRSNYGPLTDSGASATAIATGSSTFFEMIGLDQEGNKLTNVFELASDNNYNTGIVTDSYIWDATPAAFVAHTKSRDNAKEILTQMANGQLDLLFGELEDLGQDEVPDLKTTLDILKRRFLLLDEPLTLPQFDSILMPIAAIYDEDQVQDLNSKPNLTQLTKLAIDYLNLDDSPFVLLVECEELDSASHRNDSKRVVKGIESIQETLAMLLEFSKKNGETLLIFTSDHETGGLAVVSEKKYPNMQIAWSTKDHTAAVVPLFANGPGAQYFFEVQRNWQIGRLLKGLILLNP